MIRLGILADVTKLDRFDVFAGDRDRELPNSVCEFI